MRDALRGLTTRGRSFLAAGVSVFVAAVSLDTPDLLRIAVLLMALPLVSAWVVARTRYRLSSSRNLSSARTPAGQESAVTLRLDNISRLATGLLLVEDRVPYVLGSRPRFVLDRIEPRGHSEVTYLVRSDVRGRYQLGPLAIRLTDPFGMVELQRSFSARDTLVVTPVVYTLPPARLAGEWTGSGESRARSVASAGEDDAATREYHQGDDLRRVHWRSTARRGQLMVRREEQPWQSRCTILLDTRAVGHRGEGPASSFEWAVSAVASIGVHLVRSGYHVRLLTDTGGNVSSGGHEISDVGNDFEGSLLDALAVVETSANTSCQDAATALRRTGGDGLLVVVLGSMDAEEVRLFTRLRQGSTVAVAVLLDTATWAASAPVRRAGYDYDGAVDLLRASGWRVVKAHAGETIADVWPEAGRRQHDAELTGTAPRTTR